MFPGGLCWLKRGSADTPAVVINHSLGNDCSLLIAPGGVYKPNAPHVSSTGEDLEQQTAHTDKKSKTSDLVDVIVDIFFMVTVGMNMPW